MMLGFFDGCPYAVSRGLKGEEDLIRHFIHRQDLELRICKEVFPDRSVILESKNDPEEDNWKGPYGHANALLMTKPTRARTRTQRPRWRTSPWPGRRAGWACWTA